MAIRKVNVGKNFINPSFNGNNFKAFKTEKMFKTVEELLDRKKYLEKKKKEVIINTKLLTLQYR